MILCIEGNIGAGKSSAMSLLKQMFRLDPTVLFVDEPVSLWERSGMLQGMYNGTLPKSTFQLAALMTRAGALIRALAVPGVRVVVCERSPFSDKMVFAETNLKAGSLEMAAYDVAYSELLACLPRNAEIHFAHLVASVDVVAERVQRRKRAAEASAVMHEYLGVLEAAHEQMLRQFARGSATAIDATLPAVEVAQRVARLVAEGVNKRPYVHPAMLNGGLVQTWGPVQRPVTVPIEWPKPALGIASQSYAFGR